jgi:hypothetical protein
MNGAWTASAHMPGPCYQVDGNSEHRRAAAGALEILLATMRRADAPHQQSRPDWPEHRQHSHYQNQECPGIPGHDLTVLGNPRTFTRAPGVRVAVQDSDGPQPE